MFRLLAKDETAGGLESAASKFDSAFKGIAESAGLFGGFEFLKGAAEDADNATRVFQQTNAVLAATGGAAGLTAQQIGELADKYGELDGVEGTQVQNALNFVLRNQQVQKELGAGALSADGLTQTMLNLSAAMAQGGQTVDSLGAASKALSTDLADPFTATKALKAAGDTLSAGQIQQLAAFKKAGDEAGAYKLVLGSLQTATAGAAAANTTPIQQLSAKWQDMKVKIGTQLIPTISSIATVAIPVIGRVLGALTTVFSFISSNAGIFVPIVGGILAVIAATKVWAAWVAITDALADANPWVMLAQVVAAIIIAMALKFQGFRDFILTAIQYIVQTAYGSFKFMFDAWAGTIKGILEVASHIPFGLGHPFEVAANGVQTAIDKVNQLGQAINNLNLAASGDALLSGLTSALSLPKYTPPAFNAGAGLGSGLGSGLTSGLKGAAPKAVSAAQDLASRVSDALAKFKDKIVQSFGNMGSIISAAMSGPPGSNFLVGNLQQQLNKAKQFATDISTLRKYGLNATSLNELISAGPDKGADAARQLATTGLGSIGQINSLESQFNTLGNQFANQTANAEFGSSVAALKRNQVYLNFDMTGVSTDDFVKALRKAIRVKGGNVQTVLGGAG